MSRVEDGNSGDGTSDETIRILAWPAWRNKKHNTYNSRLYTELNNFGFESIEFSPLLAVFGRYSLLHLHWPDGILKTESRLKATASTLTMIALLFFVRYVRRIPIVWTVHNLRPHDSRYAQLWRLITWSLLNTISGTIHLSEAAAEEMKTENPGFDRIGHKVIYHGRYDEEYKPDNSREAFRFARGLKRNTFVFGYVGSIAPYKGLLELIMAFTTLDESHEDDFELLIAGRCADEDYSSKIVTAAAADSRIHLSLSHLSSTEMANLIVAADMIVLPYNSILNSGSIFVPIELQTPVLASRLGSIPEMATVVGGGWIQTYTGQITAVNLVDAAKPRPMVVPNLDPFAWTTIGRLTGQLFRHLIDSRNDGFSTQALPGQTSFGTEPAAK